VDRDLVIKINKRGKARVWSGHPWLFVDDLLSRKKELSGEVVRVEDENGKFLGQAFYSYHSKIALRFLSYQEKEIGASFWEERIAGAISLRKETVTKAEAYRLFFSEADGIPGLILDNYNGHLVMQALTPGVEKLIPLLAEILKKRLKPESILGRNDVPVRELEGLPQRKDVLWGERPDRVEIKEGKIKYKVDLWNGQKTGAYLDQRENRTAAIAYGGERILDGFAYQGHFSLHLASAAKSIKAIESSAAAIDIFKENLALNGLGNVEIVKGNAFDILKDLARGEERFDLVLLDPPPFSPRREDKAGARRGYKEINLRALQLLKEDGYLMTCCCSYNISEEEFLEILKEAAGDSRRRVILIEKRMQSQDHPVLLTFPESYYLKCIVLRVD
jgi:23S rRNA (cytosine1962-C5)-methyltransferase